MAVLTDVLLLDSRQRNRSVPLQDVQSVAQRVALFAGTKLGIIFEAKRLF